MLDRAPNRQRRKFFREVRTPPLAPRTLVMLGSPEVLRPVMSLYETMGVLPMPDPSLATGSMPTTSPRRRTTAVTPPPGCWPFQLPAPLAAAFAGEKTVAHFMQRCGKPGGYPAGRAHPGERRLFWLRPHLEAAIEAMHGAASDESAGGYF